MYGAKTRNKSPCARGPDIHNTQTIRSNSRWRGVVYILSHFYTIVAQVIDWCGWRRDAKYIFSSLETVSSYIKTKEKSVFPVDVHNCVGVLTVLTHARRHRIKVL